MTDGQAGAATSCEDGTESTADVRNVTFIHGDSHDVEDDDDDDEVRENVDISALSAEEEADVVPELPTDIEVEELTPPLTPDGGWGWMVVAATFVSNLVVDGVAYTFGIIMPELIDYFDSSKGKTALVGSMVSGVYLIVGPVVSALANRFGCRIVSIIGSVIAGVFFAISQFSPNIDVLIFTYGVMGGIGFGFMYLPSIVMVSFYFDRRRALATCLAVCGSGVGTFVLAPFFNFLVTEYGWKGANFITGAIIFNGVTCGLIYRPLRATVGRAGSSGSAAKDRRVKRPRSVIFRKIMEEKRRRRTTSTGSLDGTMITKDNCLVRPPPDAPDSLVDNLQVIPEHEPVCVNAASMEQNDAVAEDRVKAMMSGESAHTALPVMVASSVGSRVSVTGRVGSAGAPESPPADQKRFISQLSSPFIRQDIFYAGSVTSLREYKNSQDMATYVQSYMNIPGADAVDGSVQSVSRRAAACGVLQHMFDFSLLLSPTFIVICLSGVLPIAGLFIPFVYIYEKAVSEVSVPKAKASLILSILGVCNTLGRLAAGLLADRPWTDPVLIHNVAAIVAGLLTCMVSMFFTFELLCLYAALYGIFLAAYIALRSIVMVELLGIQKLTNAFGLCSLFQGIACVIGSPLSGAILDATGSFVVPFMVAGSLIATGGFLCLPVRRIARWEQKRNEKRRAATNF